MNVHTQDLPIFGLELNKYGQFSPTVMVRGSETQLQVNENSNTII